MMLKKIFVRHPILYAILVSITFFYYIDLMVRKLRIFYSHLLLGNFLIIIFIQCKGPKSLINDTVHDLDCPQVINYGPSNTDPIELIQFDPILTANYSFNSLVIANAYGLIDDLTDLERLKALDPDIVSSDSIRIAMLEKERQIDKVLDMAFIEIESYEGFIQCNILNLVRIRNLLTDANNKIKSKYTNAAIYTEELLMLRIDLLEELKIGIDHLARSLYVLNFEID